MAPALPPLLHPGGGARDHVLGNIVSRGVEQGLSGHVGDPTPRAWQYRQQRALVPG